MEATLGNKEASFTQPLSRTQLSSEIAWKWGGVLANRDAVLANRDAVWLVGAPIRQEVRIISIFPAIGIPPRFARDVAFCTRLCNKRFTLANKAHNLAA
jgi:hypothetical protein